MTNYTITFWEVGSLPMLVPVAIAHTTYYADAIALAKAMPNSDVIDFKTGEVLRTYRHGQMEYSV